MHLTTPARLDYRSVPSPHGAGISPSHQLRQHNYHIVNELDAVMGVEGAPIQGGNRTFSGGIVEGRVARGAHRGGRALIWRGGRVHLRELGGRSSHAGVNIGRGHYYSPNEARKPEGFHRNHNPQGVNHAVSGRRGYGGGRGGGFCH